VRRVSARGGDTRGSTRAIQVGSTDTGRAGRAVTGGEHRGAGAIQWGRTGAIGVGTTYTGEEEFRGVTGGEDIG